MPSLNIENTMTSLCYILSPTFRSGKTSWVLNLKLNEALAILNQEVCKVLFSTDLQNEISLIIIDLIYSAILLDVELHNSG